MDKKKQKDWFKDRGYISIFLTKRHYPLERKWKAMFLILKK